MKSVIAFVMILVGSAVTDMAGQCDMAGFYLELGCTPTSTDSTTLCPDMFTCPDLHPNQTMCYYRGEAYGDGSKIPQSLITNPCSQSCICNVFNGQPRFECASVDCVTTFDLDLQQQCISTYEVDSCCNTGTVCGKDAIAELKTCEVDGNSYKEGEVFEPKNSRKSCVCTPDWDGTVDNTTYCRDINCGIEIHYQDELKDRCAPMFAGNVRGCPIGFQCPTTTTKVIRGLNLRKLTSLCVFGNMTLNIGDEVTVEEKCTKCACNIPPMVSCTKLNVCDN